MMKYFHSQIFLLLAVLTGTLLSTQASYCVSWDHEDRADGAVFVDPELAKLAYTLLPSYNVKVFQKITTYTSKKYGWMSDENWQMLEDWCISHLWSLDEYCVSWHVWDYAEGMIYTNYTEAKEKYDDLKGGPYATVLDSMKVKNIEKYGDDEDDLKMIEEWCWLNRNMTITDDDDDSASSDCDDDDDDDLWSDDDEDDYWGNDDFYNRSKHADDDYEYSFDGIADDFGDDE